MEVPEITEHDKPQQKRFFCQNCQHELFLQSKYCDSCGGEIQWPGEIKKILTTWDKSEKKSK